jgi:diguanylate cyclase (GGDEF)-like protein/PAS domain S-box-containing protein
MLLYPESNPMTEKRKQPERRAVDRATLQEWKTRYNFLLQHLHESVFVVRSRDGMILEANATALQTYQYSLQEFCEMFLDDLLDPSRADEQPLVGGEDTYSARVVRAVHRKKNSEIFPVEMVYQQKAPAMDRVLLLVRDLSAPKGAVPDLNGYADNLSSLFNAITESFFLTDRHGTVIAANETFAKRMRVSLDKILGASLYDLLPADVAVQRRQQVENVIQNGRRERFEDVRNRRHIDQVIHPVLDPAGEVTRLAFFGADITQRREMEKELEALAFDDHLTGLYNRRGFFTLSKRELNRADRFEKNLLLFFADLDDLKSINDQFGHEEGDRALIAAARILVQTFRSSDIVSRIGGDEFAILAVDADEDVVEALLRRLYKLINYFNARKGQKFKLSISIGHASYDRSQSLSLDDLLSDADRAMYHMKRVKKRRE